MLEIRNIYGHGFGHAKVAELERAGFTVRPEISHYAGTQICRFLDFEEGPALELIEVADEKAYLDFVPKGMKPFAPGINLVVPDYAERELSDFDRKYKEWGPYSLHVNYDGSNDPGKPGWNYLNFERPVIRDTFLWLTRLDEPRPRRAFLPHHPNGVQGVMGLLFGMDEDALERLSRLAEAELVDGALEINGVRIWSQDALDVPLRFRDKTFPLFAVVLKAESLDGFPQDPKEIEIVSFQSRPAIRIRTNDLSWDILITER
jgi:hypothetical protein